MNFDLPKEVIELFKQFKKSGYQLYVVGGAVRDLLLNRETKDWDFTTDAIPDEIVKILNEVHEKSLSKESELNFGEPFYNNQFGTVGLNTDLGVFEITAMRRETGYSDFRHPSDVSWTKDINEDLARRDFTINAMALKYDPESGFQVIDPFEGQKDLSLKSIRTVGESGKRFHEDALRLMRAIRFATQLSFNIEENTQRAVQEQRELIKNISWERIRDELFKILASDDPYRGIVMLRETELLKIILPELEKCFGIVQEGPKHDRIYDIGEHSLLSLKHCGSSDPLVRFATLIHDIGKPDTFDTQEDGNVTFYGHDVVGSKIARRVCSRLKLSGKQTEKVVSLVRWHMYSVNEHQTDSAIRRFIKNIGVQNIDDMIALRIGDRLGGGTEKAVSWRMEEFRKRISQVLEKPFSISDLKVTGHDVMEITGLKPGREVGDILQKLFAEVLEDSDKNNRDELIKRIHELKQQNLYN